IDLNSKKVLHNTWTAHGGGNNQGPGEDGLGSNPQVSNASGSNLSSDGFIIATQASYGPLFGNNVLLKGIDENNTNMARRAVVLHGWLSPMAGYTQGVRDYNYQTETYSDPLDALK